MLTVLIEESVDLQISGEHQAKIVLVKGKDTGADQHHKQPLQRNAEPNSMAVDSGQTTMPQVHWKTRLLSLNNQNKLGASLSSLDQVKHKRPYTKHLPKYL